ncbi:VOG5461 [uncultured phage cr151_1]|uniref:Intron-encoded_endonuclease n=1 Tax=uncultured phage cr151_1 TaxID=2986406 RepID=A0AAE7RZP5_9CAUD|nr:VOG5461 [uncultured phage cr151_1]QWM89392.1 intron-encoded_endonuclease [uncultured phage cr151_1]
MNRVCNISKELLENFLKEGKTTREIGLILGVANTTISRYIRNYNLNNLYSKPKYLPYHLTKIDSKELAYMLGFIIADSSINNEIVEISVAINDSELMDLFSPLLGIKSFEDLTLVKEKRRFPKIRLVRKIVGINKFIGGNKKKDRNVPIIQKDLEVYLIRGIFDADGCITWGYRKDRNRIWHKVSFTSSLGILTSVQKVLYKIGISTIVRPKANEDCYVLEFANKKDILKFYNYLYADDSFIPLKRKFDNYNALRLELGELSENTNCTILSCATDLSVESAETTGELNGTLNNQSSTQDSINELRYSPNRGH